MEPLLRTNRKTIERILKRAKKDRTGGIKVTSNCTELDAYADLIGPGKIESIEVTLEGPSEEHLQIAHNVSMALQRGARITVRIDVDRDDLKRLPEIAAEFERRGWDTRDRFSVYVTPRAALDPADLSRAVEELVRHFPAMNIER